MNNLISILIAVVLFITISDIGAHIQQVANALNRIAEALEKLKND